MIRRFACIAVVLALLTACGGGGMVRRISEPAASIQQLTVRADGRWDVQLRINNFSSVAMRFGSTNLDIAFDNGAAAKLQSNPGIEIGQESADVVTLTVSPLPAGRAQLSRLVSRDTAALSPTQVRESAIESLAENLNDSVVAPLFWFALLGLPGAALFRFANTADAMWGYPGERGGRVWAYAGKWAARADDVLAWIPARITAVLIWLVGGLRGGARLRSEAGRTPSPNSGWPMAAMALALGVQLRKPDVYTLNAGARAPEASDTLRTCAIGSRVVLVGTLATCAAMLCALI